MPSSSPPSSAPSIEEEEEEEEEEEWDNDDDEEEEEVDEEEYECGSSGAEPVRRMLEKRSASRSVSGDVSWGGSRGETTTLRGGEKTGGAGATAGWTPWEVSWPEKVDAVSAEDEKVDEEEDEEDENEDEDEDEEECNGSRRRCGREGQGGLGTAGRSPGERSPEQIFGE